MDVRFLAMLISFAFCSVVCATSQNDVVVERMARSPKNILDLRIEKIDLARVTMETALSKITDAVNADVHDRPLLVHQH
jgi:hypothetical protein